VTKLRELRQARNMRLLDLTLATGLHVTTVSSVERGTLAAPKSMAAKLAEFYGVSAAELFNENRLAV
jgi:transcriptional regulator with XRE-family HTH domain